MRAVRSSSTREVGFGVLHNPVWVSVIELTLSGFVFAASRLRCFMSGAHSPDARCSPAGAACPATPAGIRVFIIYPDDALKPSAAGD